MEKGREPKQDKGLRGRRQEEEKGHCFLCVNNVEDKGRTSSKGINKRQGYD